MNLRSAIEHAINCNSAENGSNTPDWILAEYLTDSLAAFDKAVVARETLYGRNPSIGPAGIDMSAGPFPIDAPPPPATT